MANKINNGIRRVWWLTARAHRFHGSMKRGSGTSTRVSRTPGQQCALIMFPPLERSQSTHQEVKRDERTPPWNKMESFGNAFATPTLTTFTAVERGLTRYLMRYINGSLILPALPNLCAYLCFSDGYKD